MAFETRTCPSRPAAQTLYTVAALTPKDEIEGDMGSHQVGKQARIMVVVLSLISLYFAIYSSTTLVSLLLLGYAGVSQFFPGVVLGLYWKRATTTGVFAGMITGVGSVALTTSRPESPDL